MYISKTTNLVLASLLGLGLSSYVTVAHTAPSKTVENTEQNIQSAETHSESASEHMQNKSQEYKQQMQEHQKKMQPGHSSEQKNTNH